MLRRKFTKPGSASEPRGAHRAGWTIAGLLGGIACGLIFGEYCARLSLIGDAFIGLLRMTVLPYIVVALIANLGAGGRYTCRLGEQVKTAAADKENRLIFRVRIPESEMLLQIAPLKRSC